jgi:hypothetical protein
MSNPPPTAILRTPAQRHTQMRQSQAMSQIGGFLVLALITGPIAAITSLILYALVRKNPVRYAMLGVGFALCAIVLWWQYPVMLAEIQMVLAIGKRYQKVLQQFGSAPQNPQALMPFVQALFPPIRQLWLQAILLAPALAIYLESTRVRTMAELRESAEKQRTASENAIRRKAAQQAKHAPDAEHGSIVLGVPMSGTLKSCQHGKWAIYPASLLNRHMVLIGGSGVGKTEFVLRLAYLTAKVYDWKVFYIDAKGDYTVAKRFQEVMQHAAKIDNVAMLPQQAYNGWQGDGTAILNRLMAVEDYSEPYYRALAKTVLSLVCNAPDGMPRSSADLLSGLSLNSLARAYHGVRGVRADSLSMLSEEDLRGVYKRYFGFFDTINGKLDGGEQGWSFDTVQAGYLLLDGLALKEEARSLGRYLLEDFADYVSRRKPADQKVLLIIDEYSAISTGGVDAANLFERVRSYGAGIIVTSQSYDRLGRDADAIIGAAAATVAFQCTDPERIASRAGTTRETRSSISVEYTPPATNALSNQRTHASGTGSEREHEVPRLHGNILRELEIGECCIITNGAYLRLRAALVSEGKVVILTSAATKVRAVERSSRCTNERMIQSAYLPSQSASTPSSWPTTEEQVDL